MRKAIFLVLLLTGCTTTTIDPQVPLSKYGEECFEKPYIDKYGDSYLCQANAIAKHNKQVDIYNKMGE